MCSRISTHTKKENPNKTNKQVEPERHDIKCKSPDNNTSILSPNGANFRRQRKSFKFTFSVDMFVFERLLKLELIRTKYDKTGLENRFLSAI